MRVPWHTSPRVARIALALLASVTGAAASPAGAQHALVRGDSLLRAGRVIEAESMYYAAAGAAPRDPRARFALGRYLAARGALRVGAVLLEEARFFGGDSAWVARELAPVYARLEDYAALAALPRSPLTTVERERAAWLRDNPPAVNGADAATVAFATAREGDALGTFPAVVGRDTILVAVDPGVSGWVLDQRLGTEGKVRVFGGRPIAAGRSVGAADVRIGELRLTHVPVRFSRVFSPEAPARAGEGRARDPRPTAAARVGLDALGTLAPTFDPRAGTLTLRRDGRARTTAGERLPVLMLADGVYVPVTGALVPLAVARRRGAVPSQRRWTFDRRRGEIVLER